MHKLLIIFRTNDSPHNEIFEERRLLSRHGYKNNQLDK